MFRDEGELDAYFGHDSFEQRFWKFNQLIVQSSIGDAIIHQYR